MGLNYNLGTKMKPIVTSITLAICLMISSAVSADVYTEAVENTARSDKDRAVDTRRKPAQVMQFFQIEPGMKVLDVFAGGGYYSELLSYVVGSNGAVTLYNNQPWYDFVEKAVIPRLQDNRLSNVENMIATPESLLELNRSYDAAIFILGMHDIYYADPDYGWVAIDKEKFMSGIFHRLKEGAVFGVIDANALSGSDNAIVGKGLHRVDPQVMIDDIIAAGFVLEASSDLLKNPQDDKTTSVFSPEIRYRTDRSVLRFRKPKSQ